MIVYANEFYLEAGPEVLGNFKAGVKSWLGKKIGPAFRSSKIIPFDHPFTFRHERTGPNEVMIFGTPDQAPDYCLSITFRHNDIAVQGRAWFTRLGVERPNPESPLRFTVLLETSEVSPQVAENVITPSQPGIVTEVLKRCPLDARTPGAAVKQLSPTTADQFLFDIRNPQRFHTILVVSPDEFSEKAAVKVEELQGRVVGLAQIYEISKKRDALQLRSSLPNYYTAWDGSISIIAPSRAGKPYGRVFRQDDIEAISHDEGTSFDRFIFKELTHRHNLAKSRRHIGDDLVGQRLLAFKLQKLRDKSANVQGLEEIVKSYEEDRDKARAQNEDLEFKLLGAEERIETLKAELSEFEKKVRTLQYQLKQAKSSEESTAKVNKNEEPAPKSFKEFTGRIEVEFPNKMTLIPHAQRTLKDSIYEDRVKAWKAFQILADEFYAAFRGDLRMQDATEALQEIQARYSGNQSEVTAGRFDGYERTFNGKKYILNKHIALGNARDPRFCFRLYFEWDPALGRIIVLHAGEHLDTKST